MNLARSVDPEVVAVLSLQTNAEGRDIRGLPRFALVQDLEAVYGVAGACRLKLQLLVAVRRARMHGSAYLKAHGLNRCVCIRAQSERCSEEHQCSCENGSLYDMFHCHFPLMNRSVFVRSENVNRTLRFKRLFFLHFF